MDYMPRTVARIFKEGVAFPNAYITTSLCCPSRASILTGMYAHKHGVRLNPIPLEKETFVERLHKSGYYTGQVGKYLNSWDGSARPEFDFWVAGPDGTAYFFNQKLNVQGTWSVHPGYLTHVLRDYALEFLRRAAQQEKPFVLLFSPNAPHFASPPSGKPPQELDFLRRPSLRPGTRSFIKTYHHTVHLTGTKRTAPASRAGSKRYVP
jgi:Sulfatase